MRGGVCRRWAIRGWLFGFLTVCWVAGAPAGAATEGWLRLPEVPLEDLEPAVADQLASLRELVEAAIEDPEVSGPGLAEQIGELARHYHAYTLREPAEACYRIARRLAPGDFRWGYLLGYLLQQEGRLEEAAELYEASVAAVPAASPAWFRLGEVYRDLDREEAAASAFVEVLAREPTSAAAEAALGGLALANGEAAQAVERYERALELVPAANLLYYPLAQSYRELGQLEHARELLVMRGAVGVRVADPVVDGLAALTTGERVHLLRGQSAFRAGRFAEAAESFTRAVEAAPESVAPHIDLAAALAELDRADEAVAELRVAIDLAPANPTARFNLARLLEHQNQIEEAAVHYREAARLAPEDAEAQFHWARVLAAAGQAEAALERFRVVIQLAPPAEMARLGEAQALERLDRPSEALERLEEAHRLLPTSGLVAEALARQLAASPVLAERDGARAVELAELVFAAQPTAARLELLAMALAEAGRCAEAAGRLAELAAAAPLELRARIEVRRRTYASGPPCRP